MQEIKRVLFAGNSITHHGPAPELGWYGDWGMAASNVEKDYVHLVMDVITKKYPRAEFMIRAIVEFEKHFWEYDIKKLSELRDFDADVIIMRIAENVEDREAGERDFGKYYEKLIKYLNASGSAVVICTNCFWENINKDRQIQQAAIKNNYIYADISRIRLDEETMAIKEYDNKGVGWHPSDKGMRCIADIILKNLERVKL